ncbi:MAG: cyanophycinase, partial [Pseudobdellovibrionaceae bacterium]|nr:cyanophycinase [Pseudobdellovibrionaceae bacterium]
MKMKSTGPLVIIGGAEDKKGDRLILREFVRLAGGSAAKIVIMTVATQLPEETAAEYTEIFRDIIGSDAPIQSLGIKTREEANDLEKVAIIEDASGVFFTGGDQSRIIRLLGGTKMDTVLHDRHENGLVLAGTSAGASMISSTMIIEGPAKSTAKIGMT